MLRTFASLLLVAILVLGTFRSTEACNGSSKASRVSRTSCSSGYRTVTPRIPTVRSLPSVPAAPAARKLYCVCFPDAQGVMRMQGTTTDPEKARRAAEILQREGIQAWAGEMQPVPQGGGLTLSNGEAAIAIAYNIGPGKTRAAAIGTSGRAEAIAQN